MADEHQPIELFTCPRHLGELRITPASGDACTRRRPVMRPLSPSRPAPGGGLLCNRQREYQAGPMPRAIPTHHRPLFGFVARVVGDAGDVQPVPIDMVASRIETLLTMPHPWITVAA